MRHERFAVVLLLSTAAVLVGATGCNGDKPASAPQTEVAAPARCPGPDLASDTVSGCVCGAALVKVLVDLRPEGDRCVAEVTPASVCVAPGGVVRFKIRNGCPALGGPDRLALEITKPVHKRPLTTQRQELPELFQSCSLKVQQIAAATSQVVLCEIAQDAFEGFYKYGLTGQIVPLDPDVEVRPGRN